MHQPPLLLLLLVAVAVCAPTAVAIWMVTKMWVYAGSVACLHTLTRNALRRAHGR
jgi:hypothetical protein